MKIIDITPAHGLYWSRPTTAGCVTKVTFAPPVDMPACFPCEALVSDDGEGGREIHVAWVPDEIDLVHLARGGTLWLTVTGGLPPHRIEVQPRPGCARCARCGSGGRCGHTQTFAHFDPSLPLVAE